MSRICCVHPTVVTELLFPLVQLTAMALFACCGQDLFPVLLVGQSVATSGLGQSMRFPEIQYQ